MKTQLLIFLSAVFFTLLLFTQCKKEFLPSTENSVVPADQSSRVQDNDQTNRIRTITDINTNHAFFKRLESTPDYLNFNAELGALDLSTIKLIDFHDYPTLRAIVIPIIPVDSISGNTVMTRYLVSLFDLGASKRITFINEVSGERLNATEFVVREDKYLSTRGNVGGGLKTVVDQATGIRSHILIPSGGGSDVIEIQNWWEQFKECYETQQQNCESSPPCDVVCSVFPCAVGWAFGCALQAFF